MEIKGLLSGTGSGVRADLSSGDAALGLPGRATPSTITLPLITQPAPTAHTARPTRAETTVRLPSISVLLAQPDWLSDDRKPPSSPTTSTPSPTAISSSMNPTRPARPVYRDEEKFYIMFARISQKKTWPEIEQGFFETFGRSQRSKDGLTSIYYRIRKEWGLQDVLKTTPEASASDRAMVAMRAEGMTEEFLMSIGYLERTYQYATVPTSKK